MEFVEGETLEHFIRRSGRVQVKLALEIVAQVASGLAAVHKQKLVHRDIKPSNRRRPLPPPQNLSDQNHFGSLCEDAEQTSLSDQSFSTIRTV
jgi:serine/threonine protein kinase